MTALELLFVFDRKCFLGSKQILKFTFNRSKWQNNLVSMCLIASFTHNFYTLWKNLPARADSNDISKKPRIFLNSYTLRSLTASVKSNKYLWSRCLKSLLRWFCIISEELNIIPLEFVHRWNDFCGVKLNFLRWVVSFYKLFEQIALEEGVYSSHSCQEKIVSAISFCKNKVN